MLHTRHNNLLHRRNIQQSLMQQGWHDHQEESVLDITLLGIFVHAAYKVLFCFIYASLSLISLKEIECIAT